MNKTGILFVCCLTALVACSWAKELPKGSAIHSQSKKSVQGSVKTAAHVPVKSAVHASVKSAKRGLDLELLPKNTAVYVGTTVTLSCWVDASTDNPRIQWTEYAYSETGQLISDDDLILNHPEKERYSIVHNDPLQYELVIDSVNLLDGGVYSCADVNAPISQKQRSAAQLIVIGATQNCSTTLPTAGSAMEGQYYTIECIVDYGGNIVPNMKWSGPQPFGQAQSNTKTRVWSGLSFYAHRTMEQQYWQSLLNFTDYFLPVPVDTAENIPDFEERYDSQRITVSWTPQNMYAEPVKPLNEYLVGDVIECFADAYPTADFEWQNLRNNERIQGSLLTIPQEWEGFDQSMRCQATNIINGVSYSNDHYITVNVPAPTTTPTSTPPPTTTTPPPVSQCLDLTGRWESVTPLPAYMCLEVGENGNIHGVLRNATDTFWVDLIGVTNSDGFDHVSYTGIWPQNRAVSTFIGECSRCHGVEYLLVSAISRSKGGPPCGTPGEIYYSQEYEFKRNPTINCPPITIPTFGD